MNMKDKVLKFGEYLTENTIPSKGEIDSVLKNLQKKIMNFFPQESRTDIRDQEVQKFKKMPQGESLQSLGAELHSCELSKYTKITHTLKLKFSCEDEESRYLYDFLFSINLEKLKKSSQAKPEAPAQGQAGAQGGAQKKEETEEEIPIEICKVTVKKYDEEDFGLLGQIEELEQKIEDIDEKFILKMKSKIDEKTQTEPEGESEEDEFEIVLK